MWVFRLQTKKKTRGFGVSSCIHDAKSSLQSLARSPNEIVNKVNSLGRAFNELVKKNMPVLKPAFKERIKEMNDNECENLANEIYRKIDECQRLLEDLEVQFRNEVSSNGYDLDFLERCKSSVDGLVGSIKSATLFMEN